MKTILITGGTVFVSRYAAEYYVAKGDTVYVLNRGTRRQSAGVHLIQADRHHLGGQLKGLHFDLVIDTGYTPGDVNALMDGLGDYGCYVFISSSAVYPEDGVQPFPEQAPLGPNRFWGKYGTDKLHAEEALLARCPGAYILRPPYLYGPMNELYRESFVFECALLGRKFYLPGEGGMGLQFFHVHDLCRMIDVLLVQKPHQRIFNVGNPDMVSIRQWVELCYRIVGKTPEFVPVYDNIDQRDYFCFYPYEYRLDVSRQGEWLHGEKPLYQGLSEAFAWYQGHPSEIRKKPLISYIDDNLAKT